MKNKKKLLIGIIVILVLLAACIAIYKNRADDISSGIKVTMLGGSTMKNQGNINSMRIYC